MFALATTICAISCTMKTKAPNIIHDTITITKVDTILVHDTIYKSKYYGNVETVNIGGN